MTGPARTQLASVLAISIGVIAIWSWLRGQPRGGAGREQFAFGVVFLLTLASQPVRDSLHFGQASPFIATLALLGVAPRLARYAGLTTGLAAAVKLTPAVTWALWCLRRRGWPLLLGSVVTFLGCAIGTWIALPQPSRDYWTHHIFSTDRVGQVASLGNNSLWGVAERMGAGPPGGVLLCGLTVLLLVVWGRRNVADTARVLMVAYLASLLLSPISWTHHGVLVVPVLVALAATTQSTPARWAAGLSIIAWMLPMYKAAKAAAPLVADLVVSIRPGLLMALVVALSVQARRGSPRDPSVGDSARPQPTR